MRYNKDQSYEISNAFQMKASVVLKKDAKKAYKDALANPSGETYKALSNELCKAFDVRKPKSIGYGKQQNGGKRAIRKGYYSFAGNSPGHIQVFKYTKTTGKEVSAKVAMNIFIHEWLHHYEVSKGLQSYHTKGFFMRISEIENALSGKEKPEGLKNKRTLETIQAKGKKKDLVPA